MGGGWVGEGVVVCGLSGTDRAYCVSESNSQRSAMIVLIVPGLF